MSAATIDDGRTARARTATLVVFAANGFGFASWMSRVPDVKQMLALTPGQLGLLLLSISAGALCGLPVAGRITHRLGAQTAVRLGMASMVPGLVLAALAVELRAIVAIAIVVAGVDPANRPIQPRPVCSRSSWACWLSRRS